MITPQVRLMAAVMEFYRQEMVIRASRKALKKCEFYAVGSILDGEQGFPPCNLEETSERNEEIWCAPCEARYDSRPTYQAALRKRNAAKQKIMRWASRI